MSSVRLTIEKAHEIVVAALTASNTAPGNARMVADALIGAELAGQGGHGLRRVPAYAAQARSGKVDGHATPSAQRVRPGLLRIDAAHGFAFPALELAVDKLSAVTPEQGIAMAGLYRSHHAGVAGLTVEALAKRGLVAMMFSNSPGAIAPRGGKRPLFGTNPIAFAAPVDGAEPIVVDVSLSKVARGKIMAAAQRGEAIPEGWALDAEGESTTDAKAALAGTMVPLGDAKGTALALMVELLAAGLTGARFASEQTSFFDAEGTSPGTGQAILAIDPSGFGDAGALQRFTEMAALVEGAGAETRLPGRRRQEIARRLRETGIEVDTALYGEIKAIAS